MGMNFNALLRYNRTRALLLRVYALENQATPVSVEGAAIWTKQDWATLEFRQTKWVSRERNARQMKRPRGPSLKVALRTVDGFYLTFGQGVCSIDHVVRWLAFVTEPPWQHALLDACNLFADLLESPDGVIMSDWHPSSSAFFNGVGYDACLRSAPLGEGEVNEISDLYQVVDSEGTWTSHGYWCFRRDGQPVEWTEASREERI